MVCHSEYRKTEMGFPSIKLDICYTQETMEKTPLTISIVVPVYNEAAGLPHFHDALVTVLNASVGNSYEIIYCDDGSSDKTASLVRGWHTDNQKICLLQLSRNFGKESALSAGIAAAQGQAILTIDGDGQHPVKLIPTFITAWKNGAQVVIGVRTANKDEGWVKRLGSQLFYASFNRVVRPKLIPGSTDFRLIDREVQKVFLSLHEDNRITRGLIDWLGFQRELIHFQANPRTHGNATYSNSQLVKLAVNSFISLSSRPLYIFGYLGAFITIFGFLMGLTVGIEQIILRDPLGWKFTGTALLGIVLLFLIGIVLLSQGILSLYVAHIHSQSKGRPLYVVNQRGSTGIHLEINE